MPSSLDVSADEAAAQLGERHAAARERARAGHPTRTAERSSGDAAVDARIVWLGVLVATAVAALMRLPFLGHPSLWVDEAVTRSIVGEPTLTGVWSHVRATESTPPLYYVLVWLFGGRSATALRAVPAAALIAAVPVSYLALRRIVGEWSAAAAAVIVAVSPELVEYSMDGRAYGLFVFTSLLSVWAFSAVLATATPRRFLAWAIASIACVWTHYFGVFLIAGEVIILLVRMPDARRRTVAASLAIAAGLAPLVPMVVQQNGDARAGFITQTSVGSRVTGTVREFAMGANVPRTWLEAAGLTIACAGLLAGAVFAWRSGPERRAIIGLLAFGFVAPLALALLGIEDRFYSRNLLFLLPLAAAIAAPALLYARGAPLVAYAALAILASVWVSTNWRYQNPNWRTALVQARTADRAAAVIAVTRVGEPVVQAYLGRPAASGGVEAQSAWVIVEPYRAAHHRALGPAPVPPAVSAGLPGFRLESTREVDGFRLTLLTAAAPERIVASALPGAAVFPPPA